MRWLTSATPPKPSSAPRGGTTTSRPTPARCRWICLVLRDYVYRLRMVRYLWDTGTRAVGMVVVWDVGSYGTAARRCRPAGRSAEVAQRIRRIAPVPQHRGLQAKVQERSGGRAPRHRRHVRRRRPVELRLLRGVHVLWRCYAEKYSRPASVDGLVSHLSTEAFTYLKERRFDVLTRICLDGTGPRNAARRPCWQRLLLEFLTCGGAEKMSEHHSIGAEA